MSLKTLGACHLTGDQHFNVEGRSADSRRSYEQWEEGSRTVDTLTNRYVEDRFGDIVDLVTRTRERTCHRSSNIKSRVTSGLASLAVFSRPRDIAIGRVFRRKALGRPVSSPPSQTTVGLASPCEISTREFCSAYVGRNGGYKGPSPRDFITAASPRLLPDDVSTTTSLRTTRAGSVVVRSKLYFREKGPTFPYITSAKPSYDSTTGADNCNCLPIIHFLHFPLQWALHDPFRVRLQDLPHALCHRLDTGQAPGRERDYSK